MIKPIFKFEGEYHFLSNFYPHPITVQGVEFPSSEHAYQCAKTLNPDDWEKFKDPNLTCAKAKKLGRKVKVRDDWNDIKLQVMEVILFEKFNPFANPELYAKLKATGTAELIEGNYWGDEFWGVCDGVGENHLGKLLMKVRAEA